MKKLKREQWCWGPYFIVEEFNDPKSEEPDTGLYMRPVLMDKLLQLRHQVGRIVVHTAARGGYAASGHAPDSLHLIGLAVNFHCPDLSVVNASNAIRDLEFSGVGFYPEWRPQPGWHLDMAVRRARWVRINGDYISL